MQFFIKNYEPKTTSVETNTEIANELKIIVEGISIQRDYYLNSHNNKMIGNYIFNYFSKYKKYCQVQGDYRNIIAQNEKNNFDLVIGAHYDGPPFSPGADDNGSAIAVLLLLSKLVDNKNVAFVAFNCEEHGLKGSFDFVKHHHVNKAIILEMVGFFSDEENSQQSPPGFPSFNKGNFLAILANNRSKKLSKSLLTSARKTESTLPLKAFNIPFGLEKTKVLQDVTRSDHLPFWNKSIPAVMITDTANFRNKNYHQISDLPETLNYDKMAELVCFLVNYLKRV